MWIRALTITVAVLAMLAGVAVAQQSSAPKPTSKAREDDSANPPVAVSKQTAPTTAPAIPQVPELMVLLRSTLLAINQANLTGNYTVLRDLGTPDFQRNNSADRLKDNFQSMRSRKVDISAILLLSANLVREPSIDANGSLRLTGYFPSEPEQVNFDLAFHLIDGRWRFQSVAINTQRNEQSVEATSSTQSKTSPAPEPEAINESTTAATNRAVAPVTPPDKEAPSDKKAAAAPPSPLPDIRDNVDRLETPPALKPKPTPKPPDNPFAPF